jgi:hypothetical protein
MTQLGQPAFRREQGGHCERQAPMLCFAHRVDAEVVDWGQFSALYRVRR